MRREKKETKIKLKLININIYMLYHLSRSWIENESIAVKRRKKRNKKKVAICLINRKKKEKIREMRFIQNRPWN